MADTRLQVVVDLVDKASSKMKSITGGFDNISQKAASAGIKLTAFGTAVGLALKQTIDASNELTNSLTGLNSVANAFGANADKAKEAALSLASDGLMSVSDAATGLKNLLASRMSLDQAVNLMNAFKDSAAFGRQSALSFGQAIRGATEGIKNQNSVLVDNAGVTKNLSNILVEAGYSAQDLSKAATDTGVRMALYNGILKETSAFQGDAARLSNSLSGAQARLATQVFNLKVSIGDALAPALNDAIKIMSGYLSKVMEWIKANPELTATIVQITAAVAAFTVAMGILLGVVAVLSSPLTLIVLAVVALGAAIWFFIKTIKENLPAIGEMFKLVLEGIKIVGGAVVDAIVGFFGAMYDTVKSVMEGIWSVIKAVWDVIAGIFKFTVAFIVGLVLLAFEKMGIDIRAVWDGIRNFFTTLWSDLSRMVSEKITEIKQKIFDVLEGIKAVWSVGWNIVSGFFKSKWTELKSNTSEGMGNILNTIDEKTQPIQDAFGRMWGGVKVVTDFAWESIKSAIKAGINWMIDKLNWFIKQTNKIASSGADALGIDIPKIAEIPRLAKGGIVNSPTLAMIGEDGPEAVVPLNKKNAPPGMGGMTVNITVNGDISGEELIEKIGNALTKRLQLSTAVV